MSFAKLLNKTCSIYGKTQAQDDLGQLKETWTLSQSNVKCRGNYDRASGKDQKIGLTSILGCKFYFASDISINEGNRISFEGRIFEVDTVVKDSSDHHLEVQANITFTK